MNYKETEGGDTMFMREFVKVHDLKIYMHLPSLAQHDIKIPSSMGHGDNIMRTTGIYDPDYIKAKLNGEPEKERFHPDLYGRLLKKGNHPFELFFLEKHYEIVKDLQTFDGHGGFNMMIHLINEKMKKHEHQKH